VGAAALACLRTRPAGLVEVASPDGDYRRSDARAVVGRPSHPSLLTHKLRGPLAGCWACSAGYDLRVVFEYVQHQGAEAILLLALGTHDEVY
jgi:hypothetical protein